jgi:hypothetical protein
MITINSKIETARKHHVCGLCDSKIDIGTKYRNQFNKHDGVYTWKNHLHCEEIAGELKMYDYCDYGLDGDSFQECIREEFIKLMEHHNSEIFNYERFQYPNFEEQLKYVCEMHKIEMI